MTIELNILTRTSNSPIYFKKIRHEIIESVKKIENVIDTGILKVNHIISVDTEYTKKYVKRDCGDTKYGYINERIVDVSHIEKRNKYYNVYITNMVLSCKQNDNVKYYFVVDDDATIYPTFFSSIYKTLLTQKYDIVAWQCNYMNRIIPKTKNILLDSKNINEISALYGDIDSLNYCVSDNVFSEWKNGLHMDFTSLKESLLKTNKERRYFIEETLGYINKDGARNGNRTDKKL